MWILVIHLYYFLNSLRINLQLLRIFGITVNLFLTRTLMFQTWVHGRAFRLLEFSPCLPVCLNFSWAKMEVAAVVPLSLRVTSWPLLTYGTLALGNTRAYFAISGRAFAFWESCTSDLVTLTLYYLDLVRFTVGSILLVLLGLLGMVDISF